MATLATRLGSTAKAPSAEEAGSRTEPVRVSWPELPSPVELSVASPTGLNSAKALVGSRGGPDLPHALRRSFWEVLASVAPVWVVMSKVLTFCHKLQVLWSIISLHPIFVVDDFSGEQKPLKDALHNQAMLQDVVSFHGSWMTGGVDVDVSIALEGSSTLPTGPERTAPVSKDKGAIALKLELVPKDHLAAAARARCFELSHRRDVSAFVTHVVSLA